MAEELPLNYNKDVKSLELDEVVRQEQDSGILANATELRAVLETSFGEFHVCFSSCVALVN